MAELGWLAMTLPEDAGGLGGGGVESMLIAERFGKHLVAEPYMSTIVLGAGLIREAGSAEQQSEWLPAIAEGKAKWVFAHAEHGARFNLAEVHVKAEKSGDGWLLSGKKIVVFDAPSAVKIVVLARSGGQATETSGLGLFVVDAGGQVMNWKDYRTVDTRRSSDIPF